MTFFSRALLKFGKKLDDNFQKMIRSDPWVGQLIAHLNYTCLWHEISVLNYLHHLSCEINLTKCIKREPRRTF